MDAFKTWLAANHLDVLWTLIVAYFVPSLVQALVSPPKGSRAYLWLGALSAWGFDARKFAERVGALLEQSAGPGPRGFARWDALLVVTCLTLGTVGACRGVKVPEEAELLLHAADGACTVVALLHESGADAVCLAVHEIDSLDRHLAAAETAQRDAPLVVEARDKSRRKLRVRAHGVSAARVAVNLAQATAAP